MRQAIARNTISSWTSVPHVTTVWDVDMSAVINHRKAHKNEFAAAGVNLTITAYFIEAILAGVKAVPAANASYTDEGVIIKRYHNIGLAVALPRRIQTPIIVQPQAGILGVGAIEKRATVISKGSPLEADASDAIAFLPIVTLAFSYDHRVLDGATADAFCAAVKKALESY
jgi:2-oxoglutarate dehydrogenase E2 component (dihydrolipoamide succinyltransferase)